MEVPRLGVESELQLMAYTTATATWDPCYVCNLHHSSQQCRILNPLSKARDRTHNLMVPGWICFCCATWEHQHTFIISPFLGLLLWHMEVSRLGVKSEIHLPAYTTATATWDPSHFCDLHHSSWQCRIPKPLSEARDQTHNLKFLSQICFCCKPQREILCVLNCA